MYSFLSVVVVVELGNEASQQHRSGMTGSD
jgi:hypothetical protein